MLVTLLNPECQKIGVVDLPDDGNDYEAIQKGGYFYIRCGPDSRFYREARCYLAHWGSVSNHNPHPETAEAS